MKSVRPIFWIIAGMAVLCLAVVGFYAVKSGRFLGARVAPDGVSPAAAGSTADPQGLANAIATLLGPNAGDVGMIGTAMAVNPVPGTPNIMATWIWQLTATQTTSTPAYAVRGTVFVTGGTATVTLAGTQSTPLHTATASSTSLVPQTASPTSLVPGSATATIGLPPTATWTPRVPATLTFTPLIPPTFTNTPVPPPPTLTRTPIPPPPTLTRTPVPPPTPTATPKGHKKTPPPPAPAIPW
jgi:hypothetical protein